MITLKVKQEIIDYAREVESKTTVNRTKVSNNDTIAGNVGEMVFADFLYGDWTINNLTQNKGKTDFLDIEVKTSMHVYSPRLNLLVREDYGDKRSPQVYVQLLIDKESKEAIISDTDIHIVGYATHQQVVNSEPRDFGSSFGRSSGYRCYAVPFSQLKPMDGFKERYIRYLTKLVQKQSA